MNTKVTEIVIIIDKSGSMASFSEDTIQGVNSLITKQKTEEGYANLSMVFFNNAVSTFRWREPIRDIEPITNNEYHPSGSTSLLDAVGSTIKEMVSSLHFESSFKRSDSIVFFILSDGYENSSQLYTYTQVRQMITQQRKKNWKFVFMGADIDIMKVGDELGIAQENRFEFEKSSSGIHMSFEDMNEMSTNMRKSGNVR